MNIQKAFLISSGFLIVHFINGFILSIFEANAIGPSIPPIIGTSGPTISLAIFIASSIIGIHPIFFNYWIIALPNWSGFGFRYSITDGSLFFVPIFTIYPITSARTDKHYGNLTAASPYISCETIIRYAIFKHLYMLMAMMHLPYLFIPQ